ncbi:MAG: aldo/keto reductase [Firmicutes bacterium]|nr:aldo/keto reductase [Bacillota bacterium]
MKYVELGKTGMNVSVISFGGIPIQRNDMENTKLVVDVLEAKGVNYIDTAKAYSVSEAYLGNALKGRRDKFFLASKSMARDYEGMKKDIDDTLEKMQTEYVDLYQCHNVPVGDFEKIFAENGAYKALLEAKEAGKIRHIGFTCHHVEDMQHVIENYADKFETVMYPFNIVEDQGTEQLRKFKELGYGTIAMKPFAGGNLDDPDLALRYIAEADVIDIALAGMADPKEAEQDAGVAEHLVPLNEEELAKCDAIRKELGTQFCRRCGYCMPCTMGILIPNAFLFRNYVLRYNMLEWASQRYKSVCTVPASQCVECGVCETRCPYHLPIREMMKDTARIFGY